MTNNEGRVNDLKQRAPGDLKNLTQLMDKNTFPRREECQHRNESNFRVLRFWEAAYKTHVPTMVAIYNLETAKEQICIWNFPPTKFPLLPYETPNSLCLDTQSSLPQRLLLFLVLLKNNLLLQRSVSPHLSSRSPQSIYCDLIVTDFELLRCQTVQRFLECLVWTLVPNLSFGSHHLKTGI